MLTHVLLSNRLWKGNSVIQLQGKGCENVYCQIHSILRDDAITILAMWSSRYFSYYFIQIEKAHLNCFLELKDPEV